MRRALTLLLWLALFVAAELVVFVAVQSLPHQ